jgi:hypothetical protein
MITDQFHPKALPTAYHMQSSHMSSLLPLHDILRARPDGSAHQMYNILIGEGMSKLEAGLRRMEETRFVPSCPVDEKDIFYSLPLPPDYNPSASGTNMLENSAFEFVSLYDELPFSWNIYGSGDISGSGFVTPTGDSWAGKQGLAVNMPEGTGFIGLFQTIEAFQANYDEPVTFSAWTKLVSGSPVLTMSLKVRNMLTGTWQDAMAITVSGIASDWVRHDISVMHIGRPTSEARVFLQLNNTASGTASLILSATQLEKTTEITPWAPSPADYPPWNLTGLWGTLQASAPDRTSIYYCDNDWDFFYRAVPTRASLSDDTARYITADLQCQNKIDTLAQEWTTSFFLDSSGISKVNSSVPGETIARYNTLALSSSGTWEPLPIQPTGMTILRDLLFTLDRLDGEWGVSCINMEETLPESSGLYVLNRVPVPNFEWAIPLDASIEVAMDEDDLDSIVVRFSGSGMNPIDRKIKLWYDYYEVDNDNGLVMLREDYRNQGGVIIR